MVCVCPHMVNGKVSAECVLYVKRRMLCIWGIWACVRDAVRAWMDVRIVKNGGVCLRVSDVCVSEV